jgi:hypothetical protein
VKELIEYIQREWATVSGAPLTFLLVLIVAAGAAYAASSWRHAGIIELLRERLAAKDERLDEYRERLHATPSSGSIVAKQSNKQLQTDVLSFVSSLREWLAMRRTQDMQQQHQQWVAMTRATDEASKKQLWDAHTGALIQAGTSLNSEYDAKFKVRAIVFRDELLSRIQHPNPKAHSHNMYEHPTNPIGMGMVADDLEHMARLLG